MSRRETRQLGVLVFRDPLLLCGGLYLLLYFDASGFLRLGLMAAFLHEWGHILCYLCLLHRFPVIEVTMTGFCMRMDARARALPPGQLFWLAAAGPAVNLLLAGIWAVLLSRSMTVRDSAFWAANLLTAGFNLLPFPPLDGARMMQCLHRLLARRVLDKSAGNDCKSPPFRVK